ncbi:DUF3576 domain-containing protein [Alphaproteobacteria bacterium]|nr:DUF3576 domain-containing protein [Alphaproteobacteria bacterium]
MTMFHRFFKFARFGGILLFTLGTALLLSSCSGVKTATVEEPEVPVSIFTGKPGGIKLSDLGKEEYKSDSGLPVNALLWRAALDIASFVPLDDVDTFGGSIVTEWHQPKATPDQRLKLTMFVIGRELRSDAITVRAYIQNRLGTEWVDAGRDETLGRKLEDLVLSRARELRAATTAETVN